LIPDGTLTLITWQVMALDSFMEVAIEEARLGLAEGGIPIGSVLVHQGNILGRGHNRRVQQGSTVLHCTSTMFSPPDHPRQKFAIAVPQAPAG
jgi:hypothetical protein